MTAYVHPRTREEFEVITAIRIYGRNYKSPHHAALAIADRMSHNILRRKKAKTANWASTLNKLQARAYRRIKPTVAYILRQEKDE